MPEKKFFRSFRRYFNFQFPSSSCSTFQDCSNTYLKLDPNLSFFIFRFPSRFRNLRALSSKLPERNGRPIDEWRKQLTDTMRSNLEIGEFSRRNNNRVNLTPVLAKAGANPIKAISLFIKTKFSSKVLDGLLLSKQ